MLFVILQAREFLFAAVDGTNLDDPGLVFPGSDFAALDLEYPASVVKIDAAAGFGLYSESPSLWGLDPLPSLTQGGFRVNCDELCQFQCLHLGAFTRAGVSIHCSRTVQY